MSGALKSSERPHPVRSVEKKKENKKTKKKNPGGTVSAKNGKSPLGAPLDPFPRPAWPRYAPQNPVKLGKSAVGGNGGNPARVLDVFGEEPGEGGGRKEEGRGPALKKECVATLPTRPTLPDCSLPSFDGFQYDLIGGFDIALPRVRLRNEMRPSHS